MNNTFFGANLLNKNEVNVAIFSNYSKPDSTPISVIVNDIKVIKMDVKKQVFLNGISLYTCYFNEGFQLGNSYAIYIPNFGKRDINMSCFIDFPDFDKEYYYSGNDLGCNYTKDSTTFKLWAPLASKVVLMLKKNIEDKEFISYELKRGDCGVYSINIQGDIEGYIYNYSVCNNGRHVFTTDPYGKASIANGVSNVVVDFEKTKIEMYEEELPTYERYTDTIIYELNVRDFSSDPEAPFVNKGKYLAFEEEGLKTKNNNPIGIDYLKELGVTHVQILPIYDFKTVDELNPSSSYNWGYDPQQYFVPEGSYSTNPNDPYSRIIECKRMISSLHKHGMKVSMDVVYNHVYEADFSSFEDVVPGYYFRKRKNGVYSNGSGCGNDFASERPMAKKLILDCCKYWTKEYGIDALRFDLMGLIDVDTINTVVKICRSIKPDFMVYGEGWDMDTTIESSQKGSILNSFKMPDVGFFNDSYRDVLKGPNGVDQLKNGGYLSGNLSYRDGFKFVYQSTALDFVYPKRFINAGQSINYVECHDNYSLFDKVSSVYGVDQVKKTLTSINLINALILCSFGVPFFHIGQEVGLSKKYEDNTYNKGDEFNQMKWSLLDERNFMVKYFKSFIAFRKDFTDLCEIDPVKIGKMNKFMNLEHGGLGIELKLNKKDVLIVINPHNETVITEFDDYYELIAGEAGYSKNSEIFIKRLSALPHSVYVFEKREVTE